MCLSMHLSQRGHALPFRVFGPEAEAEVVGDDVFISSAESAPLRKTSLICSVRFAFRSGPVRFFWMWEKSVFGISGFVERGGDNLINLTAEKLETFCLSLIQVVMQMIEQLCAPCKVGAR